MHVITGLQRGGAEGAMFRLCKALKPPPQQCVVSLNGVGQFGAELAETGISVYDLKCTSYLRSASAIYKLRKIIRKWQPSVIQTWMYHADLLAGLASAGSSGPPVVWGLRSNGIAAENVKFGTRVVMRLCTALSDLLPSAIVSCSKEAIRTHSAAGYPNSRMHFIPNGFDQSVIHRRPDAARRLKEELSLKQKTILIGMVARWDPLKDHATLFAAINTILAEKADVHLVLVGRGIHSENSALMRIVERLGEFSSRVHLLGLRNDVCEIMSALDIHVLSSLSEAFPNVLAEAMLCGTPCVSTICGDSKEIIGETGWLCKAEDPSALRDCLTQALKAIGNDEHWRNRQEGCRDRIATRYSIEDMMRAYLRVWNHVCKLK